MAEEAVVESIILPVYTCTPRDVCNFHRHLLCSSDVFLCNVFLMFLKTILKLIRCCRRYFCIRLKEAFEKYVKCVIIVPVLFLLYGSVVHNLSLSVSLPCVANKRVH